MWLSFIFNCLGGSNLIFLNFDQWYAPVTHVAKKCQKWNKTCPRHQKRFRYPFLSFHPVALRFVWLALVNHKKYNCFKANHNLTLITWPKDFTFYALARHHFLYDNNKPFLFCIHPDWFCFLSMENISWSPCWFPCQRSFLEQWQITVDVFINME